MRVFALALAALYVSLALHPSPATAVVAQRPTSPRTVTLDAFVRDGKDQHIAGLTAADFRVVTAAGRQIPIAAVREITIPMGAGADVDRGGAVPLETTNAHTHDARLFVVVYEPTIDPSVYRRARVFLDELVGAKSPDDQVALFVPGRVELGEPPTANPAALARAFNRLNGARVVLDQPGLTTFVRDDLPRIYQSFLALRWVQRSIVLLSPGYVHPAAFEAYRAWQAWARRANAPMHGVDPMGAGFVEPLAMQQPFGDHPLLRQAAQETGGQLFVNRASLDGIAAEIVRASSTFYEVDADVPDDLPPDESLLMTVRTHPTATIVSRHRARVAMPDPGGARASGELSAALAAPLPMDEVPIAFSVAAPSGATNATVRFLPTSGSARADVVELPEAPLTLAFAALLENGKLQAIGTHRVGASDLRIDGCCASARYDLTIPRGAIAVRVAVYQHSTGRVGAAFLPIAQR